MHRITRLLFLFCILMTAVPLAAGDAHPDMRAYLEQKVADNPDDPNVRRLLGRLLLESGEVPSATTHLYRAVELDPLSCAARFDFGRALMAVDDAVGAAKQWQRVLELAPDSEYAIAAEQELDKLPASVVPVTRTVGYEIHEYPGPPGFKAINDSPKLPADAPSPSLPVFLRFETGLLYNSNVALAPSSRQLPPGDRESFQLFASPEIEWWAVSKGDWVAGPMFSGYFTLNEDDFSNFNLSSYAPGLFAEGTVNRDGGAPLVRLEYRYSLDEFGGAEFSQRHSVLAQLTLLQDKGGTASGYLAIDQTNFEDDGVLPDVTSADGTTYAAGMSREFQLDHRWFRSVRLGADMDRLNSSGTDFAYWGAGVTGQSVIPVMPTVDLTLRGGAGFRIFDRYQFEPDRDEFIWRTGCELRKWFTPEFSIAGIINYQMFDSNNPLFAADRIIAGLTTEFRY